MKALKAKKQILRTQISNARSRNNERQLEKALQRYFKALEKQIQRNLKFYWQDDNLVMGQVDLITEPIITTHQEYYEIIEKYLLREYELGSQEAKRLVLRLNKNRVANKAKVKKPKQNPYLQNEFIKDFYTLVSRAEGTQGIELKPIYNKLKRKYKSKVKNRAEFEKLFTKAVVSTSTRLYPSRDPDMFVKIGGRNFGYIDRRQLKRPILTEPEIEEPENIERKTIEPKQVETNAGVQINDQYNLFGTLSGAEDDLLNRTFEASMGTLMRVDQSIKDIITDGYKTGYGINYVSNKIRERFGQLHGWESKRIARTEIHNAHNRAVMDTYNEYGVEYTMWITAHDKRVRGLKKKDKANHVKLDGEIIRLGDTYSNGLRYPGDTDGPLVEWINCRCSNAPFVVPYGFMAPSFSPFREEDLIKVETKPPVTEPTPVETQEAYQINGGERYSNVEISQDVLDKIIQHQETRATAKIEWGNTVDLKTGKLNLANDVKGKKNQVTIPRPNTGQYGVLHNHPSEAPFSGGDMFNQLGYRNQNVCVATTPRGVWVARDTEFGAASKVNGLSDNTRYDIKYKMDGKYREFSRETLDKKYAERMRNATTRKEYNAIKKEYLADPEYKEKYAKWLLEEYGVGVNKYNYFEIEFIPKEELRNVKF